VHILEIYALIVDYASSTKALYTEAFSCNVLSELFYFRQSIFPGCKPEFII